MTPHTIPQTVLFPDTPTPRPCSSNGYRLRAWKHELQQLADETRLTIHASHFPPGTSKWNKIERRLFCHIKANCRGTPLTTYETIVDRIGSTRTFDPALGPGRTQRRPVSHGRHGDQGGDGRNRAGPRRVSWGMELQTATPMKFVYIDHCPYGRGQKRCRQVHTRLTRIMHEEPILGETQEPPCGVHNVLATTETPCLTRYHRRPERPSSPRQPGTREFRRRRRPAQGGRARVWLGQGVRRCLADKRAPGKIRHTLADLIGQRVFGIACGHPDGNDADHLADDPIHKLLLGRDPVSGAPLASQPTISRFENGARRTVLYRMGRELAACVIERHRRRLQGRARRITIDLDPTDDQTHGAQQLTFFNGHYGGWCYLPMLGFLSFDREAEQYLCAAVLRPGKAVAADGTLGLLCRLLPLLRAAFPRARFLVRLDGGFATPEIFDFLDAEPRLDYVVAMAKNAVLQRHAESAMQVARAQSEVGGETAHVYTDTRYAAGTWDHERRVVIKAEVVRLGDREPRDNPRFVVTNLRQTPRFIYEKVYCARGDIENRIKELLDGLQIDRTSCCLFSANQLRVFLTAAAYVLMQELRLRAARTACARSQVTWLRDRLLKLGVHVVRSVRRVVLHLPRSTPHLEAWRHIALALGARAG